MNKIIYFILGVISVLMIGATQTNQTINSSLLDLSKYRQSFPESTTVNICGQYERVIYNNQVIWPKEEVVTLRDQFAGQAMQGLISRDRVSFDDESIARWSYSLADKMMKERNKK